MIRYYENDSFIRIYKVVCCSVACCYISAAGHLMYVLGFAPQWIWLHFVQGHKGHISRYHQTTPKITRAPRS